MSFLFTLENQMPAKREKTKKSAALFADAEVTLGAGGETHQTAGADSPVLTTQQGTPVADDQNSLKVGARGPTTLEDFHFREKIFHFDHERIPERVVHARGYGAHGYFENYESLADVTRADLFQRAGEKTPAFVRFSTVAGNKGSADLARDVRGFAVKLYTKEGNWDIVGNNIPVFFIQDAIKFPDLIHAAKHEPDRGFPQAQTAHDNFWDFISLIARKHAHGDVDHVGPRDSAVVPLHGGVWRPHLSPGQRATESRPSSSFTGSPSKVCSRWSGTRRSRSTAPIPTSTGATCGMPSTPATFPNGSWDFSYSTKNSPNEFDFDVLDATKLIPEEDVPIRIVGRLVLDRVVDNFFAETEQVAFCTQNIVPGIDFSNDPLLAGPELLVSRHAGQAPGRPKLHAHSDQRTQVPIRALPARRPHGHGQPRRPH